MRAHELQWADSFCVRQNRKFVYFFFHVLISCLQSHISLLCAGGDGAALERAEEKQNKQTKFY